MFNFPTLYSFFSELRQCGLIKTGISGLGWLASNPHFAASNSASLDKVFKGI